MRKHLSFEVIVFFLLLLVCSLPCFAQRVIVVVRHAERSDAGSGGMAADPELSAAGQARAKALAAMLKDEKLTAIDPTEYKRTQQTAAPTASAQGLTTTTIEASDTPALLARS